MINLLFVLFLVTRASFAQEDNDIQIKFTESDSSYSFYGSFLTSVPPECILEICFNHEHIKELATEAKEIELLDEGKNWNKMRYTYLKLIYFENISVWYRTIDVKKRRVNFKLLSSKNSHKIMPKMLSSSGYYQVRKTGKFTKVEYQQKCVMTNVSITKLQIRMVKNGAIRFMHKFRDYIEIYQEKEH